MRDEIRDTVEAYNRFVDYYVSKYWNTLLIDYLDRFISVLPGKRVLDAGCGPGRDAKYLCSHGLNVTGIDLSEKMVEEARKRVKCARFLVMDIGNLEFDDESFDGIWCCATFLHIPKRDAKKVLEGFHRVLKRGGVLFLSLKEGEGEGWEEKIPGYRKFFVYYKEDEIKGMLEDAGFDRITVDRNTRKDGTVFLNCYARRS